MIRGKENVMLTLMSSPAMTQSRTFFVLSAIDTNPATSPVNATTGFKRHAGYGTGSDLAPGGAL
jgi:hypothetical protein